MSGRKLCSTGLIPGLIVFLGFASLPSYAVTIENANTPGYVTDNASYSGVVSILFNETGSGGQFICTGALIAQAYILTAGHCVNGASSWTVNFQTATTSYSDGVSQTFLDPLFTPYPSGSPLAGLFEYDVAVLQLANPPPADATIYQLDTDFTCDSIANSLSDIVGYGLGGNPTVGILGVGARRMAQQTIDGCTGTLNGQSTPDLPLYMQMSFSSSTPGNFGLTNGGDSGGPVFVGGQIVGVTDFGDLPRTGNYASDTEYLTGSENLSDPQIANFVDQFVVPEPGTNLMAITGLLLLIGLHRRRTCVSPTRPPQRS